MIDRILPSLLLFIFFSLCFSLLSRHTNTTKADKINKIKSNNKKITRVCLTKINKEQLKFQVKKMSELHLCFLLDIFNINSIVLLSDNRKKSNSFSCFYSIDIWSTEHICLQASDDEVSCGSYPERKEMGKKRCCVRQRIIIRKFLFFLYGARLNQFLSA